MAYRNEGFGKVQKQSRREPPPSHPGAGPQPSTRPSTTGKTRPQHPPDDNGPEAVIAVMGATGSGKSTFINLVSGSSFGVGAGLQSCTDAVQIASGFNIDGRRVTLIDTPGFDDTSLSDTDVLKMIAVFLETSYARGSTLAGVLYFYRISDFRMGGIARKNFSMFKKLCGENALKNVVIVTNMWGEVDSQVGNAREAELTREDIFFRPVLQKGARMARHENTVASAERAVRLILENHPLPLRIQEELVNEHKDISETGAGEELNRELNAQIRRHQEEMKILKEDMEQAMKDKDEETRRDLELETTRMQKEIERFQNDSERLASDYKKEKEMLEARMERMELEAKQEAERIANQYKQQIDELKNNLQSNTEASERDKAYMRSQIDDLTSKINTPRPGFWERVGSAIQSFIPIP